MLLRRHRLLHLPGQSIDAAQQRAFAMRFGPLIPEPGHDGVSRVSNRPGGHLDTRGLAFHYDYSFSPEPLEAICLFAEAVPSSGTATSFADGVAAASSLPSHLRRRLEGLDARHVADTDRTAPDTVMVQRAERFDDSFPHTVRPILWHHPNTGEVVLSASAQATDGIVGLSPSASRELLEEVFAHLYRADHCHTHSWQVGDLVIWDNLALQHARQRVDDPEPRVLRRITIGVPPAARQAYDRPT